MNYSFKKSVIDNLEKSYEVCERSLRNSDKSSQVVERAARETKQIHHKNIAEISRQRKHFKEKSSEGFKGYRKESGIRTLHPTGADVFRELTNTYLDVYEEEQEREFLTKYLPITNDQLFFRFFRSLFDNLLLRKGVFGVATAFLGVIRRLPTDVIKKACAYLNGISPSSQTEHSNFRDDKYFDQEIAKLKYKLLKRFEPLNKFELTTVDTVFPETVRKYLSKKTSEAIKLKQTDSKGEEYIYNVLNLISPWEGEPLSLEEIPKEPFKFFNIRPFKFFGNNPVDGRDIELKRIQTLLKKETGEQIIDNPSVRYEFMENNHLHSPLIDDTGVPSVWLPVNAIGKELRDKVIIEQLDQSWALQACSIGRLFVGIDNRRFVPINNSLETESTIDIPVNTKVISVYGEVKLFDGMTRMISLGTLPLHFTNIYQGTNWESESKLKNGYHLLIKLTPEANESEELKSLRLAVNYHQNFLCKYHSGLHNLLWRTYSCARNLVKSLTPNPLPKPAEPLLNQMESLGILEIKLVPVMVLTHIIIFGFLIALMTYAVYSGLNFFGNADVVSVLTKIGLILFVACGCFLLINLFKKRGINNVLSNCMQACFLGGVLFSSVFLYATKSAVERSSSFDPYSKEENLSRISNAGDKKNADELSNFSASTIASSNSEIPTSYSIGVFPVQVRGNFTASINAQTLRKGNKILAYATNKQAGDSKMGNIEENNNGVQTVSTKIRHISTTVIAVNKEPSDDSRLLVLFRLDKLFDGNGNEVKIPDCPDTLVILEAVSSLQNIQLNTTETLPEPVVSVPGVVTLGTTVSPMNTSTSSSAGVPPPLSASDLSK